MSDDFERRLRDELAREGQQVSRFPDPLRARIQGAIEPRRGFGVVRQLALAGAVILFVGLLAFGVSELRGLQGLNRAPAGSGSPVPIVSPTAFRSPSGGSCTVGSSGGGFATGSNLTGVRVAHHAGYDRITFQFDGGIPAYSIDVQTNARFVRSPSGQPVTLAGSEGLRVRFSDASGAGYSQPSGQPTYTGSLDQVVNLPVVKEVRELEDSERVLQWAIGVGGSVCYNVTELSGPARLVIDVPQTP